MAGLIPSRGPLGLKPDKLTPAQTRREKNGWSYSKLGHSLSAGVQGHPTRITLFMDATAQGARLIETLSRSAKSTTKTARRQSTTAKKPGSKAWARL